MELVLYLANCIQCSLSVVISGPALFDLTPKVIIYLRPWFKAGRGVAANFNVQFTLKIELLNNCNGTLLCIV